jgi:integrase
VGWLKKGEPMPAWMSPSPEGTALEERNVRTVFARLLAKADMRQICIHDLRHTYSTLLLQTGAPITYVSQQPGHRDASITLRVYAHWLPDVSRRVDRLDPLQPDATPAQPEAVPTTNRPSVSRLS